MNRWTSISKIEFDKNITWHFIPHYFSYPFSNKEETKKVLANISFFKDELLYVIDWTDFTSNVKIINWNDIDWNDNHNFLDAWTDWIILTWLNEIDKKQFELKHKIWIILWVWDCAPIILTSKDWNTIFNLHVWYKWLLWFEYSWFWIIDSFIAQIKELNINISDIDMYIWPMAWDNFELPRDYIVAHIEKYWLNPDKYFKNTKKVNWEQKWNFSLRILLFDILRLHGLLDFFDISINTTDPNNNWPSYRLSTIQNKPNGSRLWASIFKDLSKN